MKLHQNTLICCLSCGQNCTVDPTQDVLKRLETLGQAFSQRFGQAVGPHCVVLGKQVLTNTQENTEHSSNVWSCCSYFMSDYVFCLTEIYAGCQNLLQSHGGNAEIGTFILFHCSICSKFVWLLFICSEAQGV